MPTSWRTARGYTNGSSKRTQRARLHRKLSEVPPIGSLTCPNVEPGRRIELLSSDYKAIQVGRVGERCWHNRTSDAVPALAPRGLVGSVGRVGTKI